ncbi:MAG: hypothetical protein RR626_01825 [Anaerovoracaceae bacterium]
MKAELPEDDSLENFTPPTPEEFGQLGEDKGNLAEQTEKIDKFYTFNKKNEEFQKLLDKEYEKFKREGRGDMPFMEGGDVSTHKGSEGADFHVGPTPPEEMAGRKPSQIEEMHRARATFFGEFEELKITSSGKSAAGTAEAVAGGEAPEAELITEEKLRTLQEGANSAGKLGEASVGSQGDTSGVAPVQVTEEGSPSVVEPSTAGENKNRSSIAGKVIIIICSIILVLALAVLGIKFLAPNSAAASKIDSITNGIMNMFSGYAAEPEFISSDRSVPIEDKTGLIQLSLDQNHNEAIGAIRYNASLAYKEGVAYPDKDITGAKPMTENAWYAGEDETVYFLDQGLVATIIDYESRIAENEKATETFNTLDIGEIRIGEKGYYVWIAEYKTDANKENATTKKVCRVVVDGNKMNVEEVYTL